MAFQRLIQRAEILAHRAGCGTDINPTGVPFFLRGRKLFVRVRLDQTRINGHALAADQTFRDAARHGCLEHMAQQIAVPETTVPVLGKARVVRDPIKEEFFNKISC